MPAQHGAGLEETSRPPVEYTQPLLEEGAQWRGDAVPVAGRRVMRGQRLEEERIARRDAECPPQQLVVRLGRGPMKDVLEEEARLVGRERGQLETCQSV